MNIFKRGLIFSTFFGCCLCLALVGTSLGTRHWFESQAVQKDVATNFTDIRIDASGHIHFGLFQGVRMLNWGIGDRREVMHVTDLDPLLNEGLWVCTIIFLTLGLLFGIMGGIFAVANTANTPTYVACGVPSLYAWNGLATFSYLLSIIFWVIQFHKHLSKNVLIELEEEGWTTEGMEQFGYSFWLVVIAMIVHCVNCVVVYAATYEAKVKTVYETPDNKPGVIMLY